MAWFQKGTLSRGVLNVGVVCALGLGTIAAYGGLGAAANVRDSVNAVGWTGGGLVLGGLHNIPGYVSDGLGAGDTGQRTMLGGGQASNNQTYHGGQDVVPQSKLSAHDRDLLAKAKKAEAKRKQAAADASK